VPPAEPGGPHPADFADLLARRLGDTIDNVVFLESVDSTHAAAIRLIDHLESEDLRLRDTVIIARRQTGGLGRGGRSWVSPPGGLYLSWVRSGLSGESIGLLPMLSAAAAIDALGSIGLQGIGIKWPNDLLVDKRKLAGMLVHARHGEHGSVAVGLGVNLESVPELNEAPLHPPTAVSEHLQEVSVGHWSLDIACSFVRALSDSLAKPDPAIESWRRHLVHQPGDPLAVRLSSGAIESGTFVGLTDEGFLRLDQGSTERIVTGGDIVE
jgi:BirA family biotin operon repressor/biotin-[acetyl-CoA-carboxylase] ligase